MILETSTLTQAQKESVLSLWNQEYPESLHYELADFEKYLSALTNGQHYLLSEDDDVVKGWAFTFTRDEQKWFAIILDHSIQVQGYGTQLLNRLKETEPILHGWVIDHNRAIKPNGEI